VFRFRSLLPSAAAVALLALGGAGATSASANGLDAQMLGTGDTQLTFANDTSCQVTSGGLWAYAPVGSQLADCGTFAIAGGRLYGPDLSDHDETDTSAVAWDNSFTTWPLDNGVDVSGTGTALDPYTAVIHTRAGAVDITETETWIDGQDTFRTTIEAHNSDDATAPLTIYRALSCANGEESDGDMVNLAEHREDGSIACTPTQWSETPITEALTPVTDQSAWQIGTPETVFGRIATEQPFTDTCDDDCETLDHHVLALQWNASIPAGETREFSFKTFAGVAPSVEDDPTWGSDAPRVGQPFAPATPATFDDPAADLTYQWSRCAANCLAIDGATGPTYTPTTNDIGQRLQLKVFGTNGAGFAVAIPGTTSAAVVAGAATATTNPSIDDTAPATGHTLTGDPGTWTGAVETNPYRYAWYRCPASSPRPTGAAHRDTGCEPIDGATAGTYVPTRADIGSRLRLRVDATGVTEDGEAWSTDTDVVVLGKPVVAANAVLPDGAPKTGVLLTPDTLATFDDDQATVTYQWLRCDTSLGRAGDTAHRDGICPLIDGATSSTYVPGADDVGKYLMLLVKATNDAGSTRSYSNQTVPVQWGLPVMDTQPSIAGAGAPMIGSALLGDAGAWLYATDYAYQWVRCPAGIGRPGAAARTSCVDIDGATALDYTPTEADRGARLRLRVTATGEGGTADPRYSSYTGVVAGVPALVEGHVPTTTATGVVRAGQVVTATTGDWQYADTLTIQWQRCARLLSRAPSPCVTIDGATGESYTATAADVGSYLRVRVLAQNAYGAIGVYSAPGTVVLPAPPTVVVTPGTTDGGSTVADVQPTAALDLTVGGTLKPALGRFAGADSVTYQYQRCATSDEASCVDIPGATGDSYTPTASDVGYRLRIVATATNAGGTVTVASPMTKPVAAASVPSGTPAPPVAQPAVVAPKQCVSRRSVTLHWRMAKHVKAKSITVTVNGKKVASLKGGARSAKVSFAGRTKGTVKVVVTAKTASGKAYKTSRTYQTCVTAQAAKTPLATLVLK
jgi:hypothetical protein